MSRRHVKSCSMLSVITEMQIETTIRYYLTPVRMDITKKIYKKINADEGVERRELSYTVDEDVN